MLHSEGKEGRGGCELQNTPRDEQSAPLSQHLMIQTDALHPAAASETSAC